MDRPRDVALFVDFENIRYSVLNTYHRELSGAMLMDLARRYGQVTLARAYADFDEQPERVLRDLQVAGIAAINVAPLTPGERGRGGADLEIFIDLFEALLDRPTVDTLLLMTGDRRYIRAVTMTRHRFGKQVVVAGVRGSVSNDLIEAAGGCFEPLEFEPVADDDRRDTFIRFVDRLERSKPFITFKYVAAAMTTSTEFPGLSEDEAREFVAVAIQEGVLVKEQRQDGYRVLHLNREDPAVYTLLDANRRGEPEAYEEALDDLPYDDDDLEEEPYDEAEGPAPVGGHSP
jgi:uncharacterized LabA/DUF88 family protein